MKYISILRGINVSGQKKIAMKDLQKLYEELGFKRVQTYIQSGNVVFESSKANPLSLAAKIEKNISSHYSFDVPVLIRMAEEMEKVLKVNPFLKRKDADIARTYVTFLEREPEPAHLEKIKAYSFPPDEYMILEREIYLYVLAGYGNSKLSNNFFESKLKVRATTRNWNTVNELVRLSNL